MACFSLITNHFGTSHLQPHLNITLARNCKIYSSYPPLSWTCCKDFILFFCVCFDLFPIAMKGLKATIQVVYGVGMSYSGQGFAASYSFTVFNKRTLQSKVSRCELSWKRCEDFRVSVYVWISIILFFHVRCVVIDFCSMWQRALCTHVIVSPLLHIWCEYSYAKREIKKNSSEEINEYINE